MYGIPADLDLSAIVGERLDWILQCEFQLSLKFERGANSAAGVLIEVSNEVEVVRNQAVVARWTQEERWSSTEFQGCIGRVARTYKVHGPHELGIELSDGWGLLIRDSLPNFESFTVYPDGAHGRRIVV